MITNFFIEFANRIISFVISFFPESDGLPSEVSSALSYFGSKIGILDPIVPISTMATIISLIFTYELLIWTFKGIKWMLNHLPFIGKS